jgi:chromosome segregation ATPase
MKKILAAAIALMLFLSLAPVALADNEDTATTAPAATATPAANPFIEQVKAMRGEVRALRGQLALERQYDRQIREEIREIKGIVALDKEKVQEYKNQLKALEAQRKALIAQRKAAKPEDKPAIQAQINAVNQQIAALKTQYQPLIDQIHGNAIGRRSLKPLRDLLSPKNAALKPLFETGKALNKDLRALTVQLKDAIQAGDIQKAEGIVAQISDKVAQLMDNINQRIAIRLEMRKILDDYKAGLVQP